MSRNYDYRNAYLDQKAEAREEEEMEYEEEKITKEEEEMDRYYEEQDEMQEHWTKCYYEEITTNMQNEFSKKIQEALEETYETYGCVPGGTRVLGSDDDMIFIKKCLVNVENFDIDFNGPEIEYFNVIMSCSDIISMNDIATTTNMMEFMEKYFEELDEECYTFIQEVSLRNGASYNKQVGSDYIMIRYVPKWKLTSEKDEKAKDDILWKQQCDREDEIDRLWFIEDVKEEEKRIKRENINISEKDRLWFIQFNEDIKQYLTK